ncbi:MAG: GGDEF domain-containing protein [Bacillota bacterium]|nr:GGDEF domain-containing protein [Bacillota bacterium]
MVSEILTANIFGICLLLILLYGSLFEYKEKSKKKNWYIFLLCTGLYSQIIDAITCDLRLYELSPKAYQMVILLDYLSPFIIILSFQQYIYTYMGVKSDHYKKFRNFGIFLIVSLFIVNFLLGIRGQLFIFENGQYTHGLFYIHYLVSYFVVILYSFIVMGISVKKIGLHDTIATSLFFIIPIIALIVNMIWYEAEFTIPSTALAMLVIHIMLRSERENTLIENEVNTKRLMHLDELTKLNNRLAFNQFISHLKCENIGIIFADINGLKYVNDHFGHMKGDSYILEFSKILLQVFSKRRCVSNQWR